MRKLSKTLLSLLLIAAMLASFVVLPAAAEEPAAEQPTEAVQAAETQSTAAVEGFDLSIVMLDCGRKYFSVDSIKQIIDNASAAGFGYIMLGVGNDGMRFLLDDMSLTVNGTTSESDAVKSAIHTGNEKYHNFDIDELTQSEMDAVLAYAKEKGMGVIPMLNTPGHMDAILAAATSLTGTNCAYSGSARTIDVTNSTAVAFTQAFVQKYVDYFASKGCKYFNMGADEYANDKYLNYTGMGFGKLLDDGNYGDYITYINTLANMIDAAGMTPMAFNDGIYYGKNDGYGTVSDKIVVCYWSSGWGNYSPASASYLKEKGFKLVNTHGDYYWVLGKPDAQCSASKASAFNIKSFPGSTINDPSGAMFCIWADYPGAETEASVISKTADTIAAFGAKLPDTKQGEKSETKTDEATKISVTAPGLTGITVAAVDKGTELNGKKVAGAWNIELTTENGSYTDSATVSIPVGEEWLSYKLTGGVLESDGTTVTSDPDTKVENGVLTFTAKHFSTVVVLAEEKQQEITVTVGGTYELPLAGNGKNETSTVLNDTYATVKVKHEYQKAGETATKTDTLTADTEVYISNDGKNFLSISNGNLYNATTLDKATTKWTVEEYNNSGTYYLKSNDGYYLGVESSGIGIIFRTYNLVANKTTPSSYSSSYRWSYDASNGFNNSKYSDYYIALSNNNWTVSTSTNSSGYAYTANGEVNKTTISFTGKQVGTTQVKIGDVLYTIRVVDKAPDGAMTGTSLTLEYWITNVRVYEGKTATTTSSYQFQSTNASTDEGIEVEKVALPIGYSPFDNFKAEMYYWQAVRLDKDNKQTDASGDDETADGTTFTHVRYRAGAWQYKTLDGVWHYFLSTDQAVAYYLQKTEVTKEVDTYVKDWGYGTDKNTDGVTAGQVCAYCCSCLPGRYGLSG